MQEIFEIITDRLLEAYKYNKYVLYDCQANVGIDQAETIVNNVAIEYNNGWIAVGERLPDKPGRYLTQNSNEQIDILSYYNGWNCCENHDRTACHDYEIADIIAWQPLPELYKGKEKKNR